MGVFCPGECQCGGLRWIGLSALILLNRGHLNANSRFQTELTVLLVQREKLSSATLCSVLSYNQYYQQFEGYALIALKLCFCLLARLLLQSLNQGCFLHLRIGAL